MFVKLDDINITQILLNYFRGRITKYSTYPLKRHTSSTRYISAMRYVNITIKINSNVIFNYNTDNDKTEK